jgi:hypothetical protein
MVKGSSRLGSGADERTNSYRALVGRENSIEVWSLLRSS